MDREFMDKVALITGASAGIGHAAVAAFAMRGARLVICARNGERLRLSIEKLNAASDRIVALEGDVADNGLPDRAVAAARKHFGASIDILVFNAGGPSPGATLATDEADWRAAAETTYLGLRRFAAALVPSMRDKGWGRIVAVTSTAAKEPAAGMAIPSAMRAAMVAMVKTLALEEGRFGITANSILTGGVLTDRFERLIGIEADKTGETRDAVRERLARGVPIGRFATPDEFVETIAFLASPRASYVNGSALAVDGGSMRSAF